MASGYARSPLVARPEFQRPAAVETLLEGRAGHVLHDEVRQAVGFLDGVDGDDVVVGDRGRGPGFAGETLPRGRVGRQPGRHDLDRDHAVQLPVEGTQHDAHAATADDLEDLIMPQPTQGAGRVGRGQEIERLPVPIVHGRFALRLLGTRGARQFLRRALNGRLSQEVARRLVRSEQRLDPLAQRRVVGTRLIEVSRAFGRCVLRSAWAKITSTVIRNTTEKGSLRHRPHPAMRESGLDDLMVI